MSRWVLEPGHTAVEFCVRHMMVTYVKGHFKGVHGALEFDPEAPADPPGRHRTVGADCPSTGPLDRLTRRGAD